VSKAPLLERIQNFLKDNDGDVPLSVIYDAFKEEKQTTIRGRINEAVSASKHIVRTKKGHYMLLGAEVEALVETADSRGKMFEILKANIYYDLVFPDPPYKTGGQKGGNRDLSSYMMIEPEEFALLVKQIEKMLRTESSQVYFMIAGGKSSEAAANQYIRAFDETALIKAAEGSYTKLNSNGTVCNMGKYLMPPEKILVFSADGKLVKPEETVLDFSFVRPPLPRSGGYPTQKPLGLIKQIVEQSTSPGDKGLDPFLGSGVFLEACLSLGRKVHGIELSPDAIGQHVFPKMKTFGEEYVGSLNSALHYYEAMATQRAVSARQATLFDFLDEQAIMATGTRHIAPKQVVLFAEEIHEESYARRPNSPR